MHFIEALFGGETAVALAPVNKGTPALVVLARIKNERKAREQLANLEVPLSQLFPAPKQGSGQVPEFSAHQVDGVSAHQISLPPGSHSTTPSSDGWWWSQRAWVELPPSRVIRGRFGASLSIPRPCPVSRGRSPR